MSLRRKRARREHVPVGRNALPDDARCTVPASGVSDDNEHDFSQPAAMSRPLGKLGESLEEGNAGGGIHDEKAAQIG